MKTFLNVMFWFGCFSLFCSITLGVFMTPRVNEPDDFGHVHRKEILRNLIVCIFLLVLGLLFMFVPLFFQPDLVSGFRFPKISAERLPTVLPSLASWGSTVISRIFHRDRSRSWQFNYQTRNFATLGPFIS